MPKSLAELLDDAVALDRLTEAGKGYEEEQPSTWAQRQITGPLGRFGEVLAEEVGGGLETILRGHPLMKPLGVLRTVFSPLTMVGKAGLGEPVARMLESLGVSKGTAEFAGEFPAQFPYFLPFGPLVRGESILRPALEAFGITGRAARVAPRVPVPTVPSRVGLPSRVLTSGVEERLGTPIRRGPVGEAAERPTGKTLRQIKEEAAERRHWRETRENVGWQETEPGPEVERMISAREAEEALKKFPPVVEGPGQLSPEVADLTNTFTRGMQQPIDELVSAAEKMVERKRLVEAAEKILAEKAVAEPVLTAIQEAKTHAARNLETADTLQKQMLLRQWLRKTGKMK